MNEKTTGVKTDRTSF